MKRKKRKSYPSRPPQSQRITPPAVDQVPRTPALPGEFENHESLVFGCTALIQTYPQVFVDFVRVAHERIHLIGILQPEHRQLAELLLAAAGLPLDAFEMVEGTTSSVWARDWSPFLGYDQNGKRCQFYVDRSHMRHRDDNVARGIFEKRFGGTPYDIPIAMEGGNLLSNGQGIILTSQTVMVTNQVRHSREELARIFENSIGFSKWAAVLPLHGERTGHVDLFATFLSPDLLIVGAADEKEDPINHRTLNETAETLRNLDTPAGKLRVERIPMPSSKDCHFRSYNNVIFANGLLIVPVYPRSNPKLDRRVLDIYREYLPGWEVVGIDLRSLAFKGGGLHCLSVNVPPPDRVAINIPPRPVAA